MRYQSFYRTIAVLLLAALVLGSCYEEETILYRIPKGEHESLPRLYRTIDRSPLTFYVKFDESARYDLNNHNQGDINKLFGFTDCNATVHDDSARFGWRYNTITQLIELFSYVYCNSTVQYSLLGSVKPGEWVKCTIDIGSQYSFILNNTVTVMKRCNNCNTGVYVQLHPYFGGDEVAPHDITIAIKTY